jgi:hypothetical protein
MRDLLSLAFEITSSQYMELENPIFIGQTRLDENNQYWMVFENNGIMYKISNQI